MLDLDQATHIPLPPLELYPLAMDTLPLEAMLESLPPASPDLLNIPAIQLEVKDTLPIQLDLKELSSFKLPLRAIPPPKVTYNLILVTSVPATTKVVQYETQPVTTKVVQYETQNVQPIAVSKVEKVDTTVVNNEVIE